MPVTLSASGERRDSAPPGQSQFSPTTPGLQQARDTRLPAVSIHRRFRVLVEDELDGLAGTDGLRLVADPSATETIGTAPTRHNPGGLNQRILIAIGPDGGWNAFEIALLEARG